MNIFKKMKYKDLINLITDKELLNKMISNKNFKKNYSKLIKKFIKDLKVYGIKTDGYISFEPIINHLKCILEVGDNEKNIKKYIDYVINNNQHSTIINNPFMVVDKNYDQIEQLGIIPCDNINEIIKEGYSDRLIIFLKANPNASNIISKIPSSYFQDETWNIIKDNPKLGNSTLIEYIIQNPDTIIYLSQVINNDYYEGFKYTYENIPSSKNFFTSKAAYKSIKQFDMNFIKNIGPDILNKIYEYKMFEDEIQFDKIFKIAECGNYELIRDVIDLKNNTGSTLNFKDIPEQNIEKNIFEAQNSFSKRDVFLLKYLGLNHTEVGYIKLFIDAIIRLKWPDEYKNKYDEIIRLINTVLKSPDAKILELSKKIDVNNKDKYLKLIKACEAEGNILIRNDFSSTLKEKYNQINNSARHRTETSDSGKKIDVFELEGQPFTMLVHVIGNNKLSENNDYGQKIIDNPYYWENSSGGNQHISTSLISEQHIVTYGDPEEEPDMIIFGFYDVTPNDIRMTEIKDLGIHRYASSNMNYDMRETGIYSVKTNTVSPVDYLLKKTIANNKNEWNEIIIPRIDEKNGQKRRPDYIVCINIINEASKRAAEYFNIPIYIINKNAYTAKNAGYENTSTNEINFEASGKSR